MQLKDKVILVTGSASGIGEAVVIGAVREGAKVIITDIQVELGSALAKRLNCEFIELDVSNRDHWAEIQQQVHNRYGRLDGLVNNAGIFRPGNIEETSDDVWDTVIDINLKGTMLGCQAAIEMMINNPEGPSGSIINVSSLAGIIGLADGAAYTASKGAVRSLSKSIAVHCAREYKTIRCNSVHPGAIDTSMTQGSFNLTDNPATTRQLFNSLQPIARMGRADEVSDSILYLASDQSSFVTGTEIIIDGGWLAAAGPL